MEKWQIDALKIINEATDKFVEDIRNSADAYANDVIKGETYYSEITVPDVLQWLWESA